MNAKIILLAAKQNTVLRGHPWIFPKAIARTSGKLITGNLVDIYSADENLIGVGAYNEHSLYRVRVLALANEQINMGSFYSLITHRLQQANQVRTCLNLPNEQTTAYRFFNSEADGLSGLTIDRFNQVCVVASSAYWVELNREIITNALQELFPQDQIIWMPQSKPLGQCRLVGRRLQGCGTIVAHLPLWLQHAASGWKPDRREHPRLVGRYLLSSLRSWTS